MAKKASASTRRASKRSRRPLWVKQVDVLLVVVTDVERDTVLEAFGRPPGTETEVGSTRNYYPLGTLGGDRIGLVQSEMGSVAPGGSHSTVATAIRELGSSLHSIVMVGIAFGVDPQKQQLGDVLVSTSVVQYEHQRVGTDAQGQRDTVARGMEVPASTRLVARLRAAAASRRDLRCRFGQLLSGEKLIDNRQFLEELLAQYQRAIGGEMEGAGLATAAHDAGGVDWIVVKAICDWADGSKAENKTSRQALAAQNAAHLVFDAVQHSGFGMRDPDHTVLHELGKTYAKLGDLLGAMVERLRSAIQSSRDERALRHDMELVQDVCRLLTPLAEAPATLGAMLVRLGSRPLTTSVDQWGRVEYRLGELEKNLQDVWAIMDGASITSRVDYAPLRELLRDKGVLFAELAVAKPSTLRDLYELRQAGRQMNRFARRSDHVLRALMADFRRRGQDDDPADLGLYVRDDDDADVFEPSPDHEELRRRLAQLASLDDAENDEILLADLAGLAAESGISPNGLAAMSDVLPSDRRALLVTYLLLHLTPDAQDLRATVEKPLVEMGLTADDGMPAAVAEVLTLQYARQGDLEGCRRVWQGGRIGAIRKSAVDAIAQAATRHRGRFTSDLAALFNDPVERFGFLLRALSLLAYDDLSDRRVVDAALASYRTARRDIESASDLSEFATLLVKLDRPHDAAGVLAAIPSGFDFFYAADQLIAACRTSDPELAKSTLLLVRDRDANAREMLSVAKRQAELGDTTEAEATFQRVEERLAGRGAQGRDDLWHLIEAEFESGFEARAIALLPDFAQAMRKVVDGSTLLWKSDEILATLVKHPGAAEAWPIARRMVDLNYLHQAIGFVESMKDVDVANCMALLDHIVEVVRVGSVKLVVAFGVAKRAQGLGFEQTAQDLLKIIASEIGGPRDDEADVPRELTQHYLSRGETSTALALIKRRLTRDTSAWMAAHYFGQVLKDNHLALALTVQDAILAELALQDRGPEYLSKVMVEMALDLLDEGHVDKAIALNQRVVVPSIADDGWYRMAWRVATTSLERALGLTRHIRGSEKRDETYAAIAASICDQPSATIARVVDEIERQAPRDRARHEIVERLAQRRRVDDAAEFARAIQDASLRGEALRVLSKVCIDAGDLDAARRLFS